MSNRKSTTQDLIVWFDFMVKGQEAICDPGHLIAEALPTEAGGSYSPSFLRKVWANYDLWGYAEQRGFTFDKGPDGRVEIWYIGTVEEREAIKEEHRRLTDKATEVAKEEHATDDVLDALPYFAGISTGWIITPIFRRFVRKHWLKGYDSKGYDTAYRIVRKAEQLLKVGQHN